MESRIAANVWLCMHTELYLKKRQRLKGRCFISNTKKDQFTCLAATMRRAA